jgi:hypothetical protein
VPVPRSRWVEAVVQTYLQHANRTAFALTEPRTAIMEAFTRLREGHGKGGGGGGATVTPDTWTPDTVTPVYLGGTASWPLFARYCTTAGPKCAFSTTPPAGAVGSRPYTLVMLYATPSLSPTHPPYTTSPLYSRSAAIP